MNHIEVIGLGALNIDNIYQVERILEDGEAVGKESGLFPGGSAANTIYGLSRLGIKTGFIGVIGDDMGGKILLDDFRKTGVDIDQIGVKHRVKTGSTLCLSDRLGKRSLYVLPGANNLLTMDDLDIDYINQAKMLHLSSFVDDKQFNILKEVLTGLDSSVKFSFSPGALYVSRGLDELKPILARTGILFINESEIRQLTGDDFKAGAEICFKQGCQIVVVTLGEGTSYNKTMATSYIRDAEKEYVVESSNENIVSVLDTTGAGDAFATGFLYGLLNNRELEKCGRLGNIVAQFSISKVGARDGLPTIDKLAQRYQELYSEQL